MELHRRGEVARGLEEAAAQLAEEEAEAARVMARVDAALAGGRAERAETGPGATHGAAGAANTAAGGQGAGRRRRAQQRLAPPFDRGAWRNLSEVVFPHYHLRRAAAAAARDSGASKKGA